MNYFDRNPRAFRILVGILTLYLLGMAGIIFYRYGSSPTDENWFSAPPSSLYVTENIPAAPDSIRVGDMLVRLNGQAVRDMVDLKRSTVSTDNSLPATVEVFRLPLDRKLQYSLPPGIRLDGSVRELPPTAYVFDVIEDGASDRAGMKAGDLILRINGQTFSNIIQADSILRSGQIGKEIEYVVIRDNRELSLHVTLAAFGLPFSLLIISLCGLTYMGFGGFVAFKRPQLRAARMLGIAFLLLGFSLIVLMLLHSLGGGLLQTLRNVTIVISCYLGLALLFHSEQYFPKERPELLSRRWIRVVLYLLAAAGCIGELLFKEVYFLVVVGVMFIFAIAVKIAFRKKETEEHKRLSALITWVRLGAGISAGLIITSLIVFGRANDRTIGYIGIPLLAMPFAYLYTIGRYSLLDMKLRIRRSVQYSFVSVAWVALSVSLLLTILLRLPSMHLSLPNVQLTGGSIEIVDIPMRPEYRTMLEKGVLMLLAIGLTFLFRKIGRDGQAFLARKFYRAKYDYRRAANELTEVMATRLNMSELARGVVAKLAELMQLKHAGVFFFRQQKICCCQEAFGFSNNEWDTFCLSLPANLADSISRFRGEFSVDYLPPGLKENFHRHGFQIVIPIRSKEKLVGALLLGEKLSESPFQPEDFEFLSAVANQASVSIENAFLYEELAEQDRMKHELEIARRIQLESLPQKTPEVAGLEVAGISIPAMEVGGDYYDYLNGSVTDLAVIVGDVSGKGTSAALYMSKVQGIMRSLHGFGLSPKELFVRANGLLCNDLEKKSFVTAVGGFFATDTRRLVLARAGHLPVFVYRNCTRSVDRVIPKGIGFGLSPDDLFATELEEKTLHYESGDVFLFVTDGVTEARRSSGEQFGEESLSTLLQKVSHSSARDIRDSVISSVRDFVGEEHQHDDQTVVVVKAT